MFPGWYSGRAIHIHFKIRKDDYEFTSQLFFDESTIDSVLATSAYASRGTPDTDNSEDNIYGSDGSELTVALKSDGSGGLKGTFTVGLADIAGDGTVALRLRRLRVHQTQSGRRVLRLTTHGSESVRVRASVARGKRLIVRKRFTLENGTHGLNVAIPNHVQAGSARLTLVVRDAAGNTKKIRRTVHIPR